MRSLEDMSAAEADLRKRVVACLDSARRIAEQPVSSLVEGIRRVGELRRAVYEDLNQLQHEALVLDAALFLKRHRFPHAAVKWSWNPQQSGTGDEPDLLGVDGNTVLVSAEATASAKAIGTIRERMIVTLTKLSRMPGRQMYFVRSSPMEHSARRVVAREGFGIEIVCLSV